MSNYIQKSYQKKYGNKDNTMETNIIEDVTYLVGQANNNAPAYKVYTALLSQSGTDAPVANVLENTLGSEVVWTRSGVGAYEANITIQVFNEQNFYVSGLSNGVAQAILIPITDFNTIVGYYSVYYNAPNRFLLEFYDSTFNYVEFSDLFTNPQFIFYLPEIRVYN